jgi:ectoine hydroxylase-related dioxygenase (phytanoyl-CoA dioxygenase family)
MLTELTPAELAAYHRDGFAVMPDFIDADVVAELRQAYDEIIEREVDAPGDRMLGGITRQVMFPAQAHPVFNRNAAIAVARRLAAQVFESDDVVRTFDMLIYKPPGHPHPTPWHQDMSYAEMPVARAGLRIPLETIQFWVALDDADAENGCMHFIPGQHTKPLLDHHVASGEPEDEGRLLALVDPDAQLNLSAAVCGAIPAGGATMHSFGTPHYTPPNSSTDRPRRAYIFNLAERRTAHRES